MWKKVRVEELWWGETGPKGQLYSAQQTEEFFSVLFSL
jgi:hypothetical protein